MNSGELDEILIKMKLVEMRDNNETLFNKKIFSVGFNGKEFKSLRKGVILSELSSEESILKESSFIGIDKAPFSAKADVFINGVGYSLKSFKKSPPALINHTPRPGFENICKRTNSDITELDSMVSVYNRLRSKNLIKEDIKINDPLCPFNNKEYFRPLLEYCLFEGTGSKDSSAKAEYILEFSNPLDTSTFNLLNKKEAVDDVWDSLIFSIRSKGMPSNWTPSCTNKNSESISKWVIPINGSYKGSLHIRQSATLKIPA